MEHLDVDEGGTVELDRVLLIADGDEVTVGKPVIDDAKVLATAQRNGRGDKVIVFKYKSKVRYRRKTGHRPIYTSLAIDRIVEPEVAPEEPAKKPRRRRKEVTERGT